MEMQLLPNGLLHTLRQLGRDEPWAAGFLWDQLKDECTKGEYPGRGSSDRSSSDVSPVVNWMKPFSLTHELGVVEVSVGAGSAVPS